MLRLTSATQAAKTNFPQRLGLLSGLVLLTSSSLVSLTGCGLGSISANDPLTPLAIRGRVFGGAQPVKNSAVTLYAASQTGYAGLSNVLASTTTDANGNFDITGLYSCPTNSQVYLVSAGGDPGTGSNNANLVLAAGLGTCSGALSPDLFININEPTTVATAYALSGFSTDVSHVGTSATNVLGLSNAMQTINNLVNIGSGQALTITPAYASSSIAATHTSIVPQATINTLADILTGCVNSSGGVAGDGSGCGNLFSAIAGGGGPNVTDTFGAALAIAQRPGQNVAAIYSTVPPLVGSPFLPILSAQPNDWMLSVTYVGGGLGGSTSATIPGVYDLKVDASGNIWMPAFRTGRIIELDNFGAPLSPSTTGSGAGLGGFSTGGAGTPTAIAIDTQGRAWVAQSNGSVAALSSSGVPLPNSPFADSSMPNASGITIDGFDNVWVPSNISSTVVKLDSNGNFQSGPGYTASISNPNGGIAVDAAENIFVINGNATITELNNSGGLVGSGNASQKVSSPGNKVAIDGLGHEFVGQDGVSNTILKATGTSVGTLFPPYNVFSPSAVAVDGAANVWATNVGGQPKQTPPGPYVPANLVELSNTGASLAPSGTGFSLNSSNANPQGVGIDGSGNVWVANFNSATGTTGSSTVQEYIGAAVPVVTPIAQAVKTNSLGRRP